VRRVECRATRAAAARLLVGLAIVGLFAADARGDEPGWGPGFQAPGLNGDVLALTRFEGDLIAAGRFTLAGQTPAQHVARWDGAAWIPLGLGLSEEVQALAG
jgi:hypothetical protein